MSNQTSSAVATTRLNQPTSYGNPKTQHDRRFYRIVGGWFNNINTVLLILVLISASTALGLLVYAGIGIKHGENYASDGTDFSCRLSTTGGKKQ